MNRSTEMLRISRYDGARLRTWAKASGLSVVEMLTAVLDSHQERLATGAGPAPASHSEAASHRVVASQSVERYRYERAEDIP
jgi:hypothetical protein